MPRVLIAVLLFSLAALASPARAQSSQSTMIGGCRIAELQSIEQQSDKVKTAEGVEENVSTALRSVRVDCDGMQFFAERMQVFHDRGRVVANGNVLFISGGHRISADRMDFDTKTRTGTFFEAHGVVSLGERADRSLFGTQEPDATFWGKEVQKIGPEKYRIVDGGFTTCAQPTPRWDVASGSVTLNLDDYALLVNSVFRVKGVPILYLPVFYYPIQEDDRATGFLIPTYGTSRVRGQTLSNAFFWAIGRSHDATFLHDWFSKTGQGYGGEYRYELGGGSQGSSRVYVINEKETSSVDSSGQQVTQPSKRSYHVTGALTQGLGRSFRARANADYFSDIVTQQRYQQDVYHATNSRRGFGGNITGNWAGYVLSGTLDRTDYFYPDDTVTTQGSLPRITVSRGEKPIGRSPLYFGANGEYVTFLRSTERDDVTSNDQGLTRLDFNPTVRIPFTRWPFLSVNSAVAWRGTYWTESKNPLTGLNVPEGIGRQYFDFSTRITGPVFHRIFDRPGGEYAEKFKHVVEPTLSIQRTTAIDEFNRIVQLEGSDYAVGNVTRVSYGLNNRLYAKKRLSREILSLILGQTYYTDPTAAQFDHNYQSSFSGVRASKFSPMSVLVRTSPTDRIQGEFRTEYDFFVDAFRTYAATGSVNASRVQVSAGWSRRRFIPNLQGFNDPNLANHYLNASATVRGARNRVGAQYEFNYDLRQDTFLQQRLMAYYNAQCCGISVEYQNFNFNNGFAGVPVSEDRRFNISFTLAGIGSFSNALGAFGGQQSR